VSVVSLRAPWCWPCTLCHASGHLRRCLTHALSPMHPHTCHQPLHNNNMLVTPMPKIQKNSLATVIEQPLYILLWAVLYCSGKLKLIFGAYSVGVRDNSPTCTLQPRGSPDHHLTEDKIWVIIRIFPATRNTRLFVPASSRPVVLPQNYGIAILLSIRRRLL